MLKSIAKHGLPAAAFLGAIAAPAVAAAQDTASAPDKNSVTFQVPLAVAHDRAFPSRVRTWNEGVGQNLGVIVEYKREIADNLIGNGRLNIGVTAGFYNNSFHRSTKVAGGIIEFEMPLTNTFSLQAGTPFGIATGYGFNKKTGAHNDALTPMGAPYLGLTARVADHVAVGVRAQVIPAKLVMDVLGKEGRHANAGIVSATLSFGF